MIVSPEKWDYIYTTPTLDEIEQVLFNAVAHTGCSNLCLSGGVDSSLTLHFMAQLYPSITCFTIASSLKHPDVFHSKIIAEKYKAKHLIYIPTKTDIESNKVDGDYQGDVAVKLLYQFISKYTNEVIATDCIDELDCGYYPHQKEPNDEVFRRFISELEEYHLKPLNKNSGDIKVHLPYADKEVIHTFLRIPIAQKVNESIRKSHVMAIALKYIPTEIIERRKYGFCDAFIIKENTN